MLAWLRQPLETLEWCHERYGDVFTIDLGELGPHVFVADPSLIGEIFKGDPETLYAGEPNTILAPMLGTRSVLTSDGARHMRQRKLLLPAFHGQRLEVYRDQLRELAEAMVAAWPTGREFTVAPEFQAFTLEVIVRLVFGVENPERRSRLLELLPAMGLAATPGVLSNPAARDRGSEVSARRFAGIRGEVDALVMAEISERRGGGAGDRDDILSLLLAATDDQGEALTDAELRDELMTLLVAGHETTATALSWSLDLVLHHPDVHRRLVAAVTEGGDDAYIDATIKEVHRVRPTVPHFVRRVMAPLRLGGWTIPAGAVLSPVVHLVHRRPELYPEPHAFRPTRFLDARTPSYAWLPFGGGIRRCIGASFATLEMEEALRAVFSRLRLEPADPDRLEHPRRRMVMSVPARGTRVVVRERIPASASDHDPASQSR